MTAETSRLISVLILCSNGIFAQAVPSPQANDQSAAQQTKLEDRCTIEGTISSLKTGQPLRKAEVVVRRLEGNLQTSYSATTDAAGNYSIENIEPGKYSLRASRNGYVSTSYGSEGKKRTSSSITLVPAQHMTKADVRLPSQAVITGRVVDEDGEPMARVRIQLMSRGYNNGKLVLRPGESATSDDKGEYRIFGVPAGKYWLLASPSNNYLNGEQADSSKKPQTSYSDTYYPGTLSVAEASQIQTAAGTEADDVDFRLTKSRSFTISGRLINSRKSQDVGVQLVPSDGKSGSISWNSTKFTMANINGKYTFRGVQPGSYYVSATVYSEEDRSSARSEVSVADRDVDVPLVFGQNPDLHGTVRSEDQSDALKLDMRIMLQPEGRMVGPMPSAEVKEDGSFTLKSVPLERLRLSLYPIPDGHYIKSMQLGDAELEDTTVDLTNGGAGELTVTLSQNAATISGTVQDDQQKSVRSATVMLVPDDRKLQSHYKTASPDQNGQFVLKNIHPGRYKLFAFDSVEYGIWLDPDWLKQYESKGESMEVKESEKATKNLTLIVTDEQ